MWKKDEIPAPAPPPTHEPRPVTEHAAPKGSDESATIGRSITIKGEVTGDEDLLIQGHVDGSVQLRQHAVRVGSEGKVKASIVARLVTVEGRVEGDITAEEQIALRNSAWVEGDLTAPRVVLEDGARFRGGVDMGDPGDQASRRSGNPAAAPVQKGVDSVRPPDAVKALGLGESAGEKGKGAPRVTG